MSSEAKTLFKNLLFIYSFIFVFIVIASYLTFGWVNFSISSSNMEPTLEVGDRFLVNKSTFGYSENNVPTSPNLIKEAKMFDQAPERGDVIVFRLPYKNNTRFVNRLIGLPGDRIQLRQGKLYLNNTLVKRTFIRDIAYTDYRGTRRIVKEYEEELPASDGLESTKHRIYEKSDYEPFVDNTDVYIVPEGHAFMMGDNRDGSADSRYLHDMGFVRFEYIVGTASVTTFSLYDCDQGKDVFCPAGVPLGRFFTWIE